LTGGPDEQDQSVEGGALDPEGEGERMPGPRQDDPVESGALEEAGEEGL